MPELETEVTVSQDDNSQAGFDRNEIERLLAEIKGLPKFGDAAKKRVSMLSGLAAQSPELLTYLKERLNGASGSLKIYLWVIVAVAQSHEDVINSTAE